MHQSFYLSETSLKHKYTKSTELNTMVSSVSLVKESIKKEHKKDQDRDRDHLLSSDYKLNNK